MLSEDFRVLHEEQQTEEWDKWIVSAAAHFLEPISLSSSQASLSPYQNKNQWSSEKDNRIQSIQCIIHAIHYTIKRNW